MAEICRGYPVAEISLAFSEEICYHKVVEFLCRNGGSMYNHKTLKDLTMKDNFIQDGFMTEKLRLQLYKIQKEEARRKVNE